MNNTRHVKAGNGNRIAFGVLILLVSLFAFVCICGAFGGVGKMVSSVLIGFFGLADFAYSLVAVAVAVAVIFNFKVRVSAGRIFKISLMFVFGIWALHIYSSSGHLPDNSYGEYLMSCYNGANTAGGMLYGIISYPLMKLITTVGALSLVCALFFVMALIACIPTISKNVTYTTETVRPKEKRQRGSRMDKQRNPSITDFSGENGGGSLYVVDVDGDPMSKSRRKAKGAAGYDPLYPNAGARYEDEIRTSGQSQKPAPDRFSSRSLAKDLLFSPSPDEQSWDNYQTMTNPDGALANPGATFNAVRRNELRRRLGVDDTDSLARDMVRERYFGEQREEEPAQPAERESNIINPDARGASALGYPSFDDLKADRTRRFGEMFSDNLTTPKAPYSSEPQPGQTYSGSENSGGQSFGNGFGQNSATVRREVPKPSRVMPKPASGVQTGVSGGTSAANMAGLHGSVSRAITGEEIPKPPAGNTIPDATAYERAGRPEGARADAFDSAVRAAQATAREMAANQQPQRAASQSAERRVPRAFEGTAVYNDTARNANTVSDDRQVNERTDGAGKADSSRAAAPKKEVGIANAFGANISSTERLREDAPSPAVNTRQEQKRAPQREASVSENSFTTSGGKGNVSAALQKKFDDAVSRGVRDEDVPSFDDKGKVIQQSIFAKQQMENIAKARKEAPPLASYEHIAEERSKRIYAPRDKSLQKMENLAKKMAQSTSSDRLTQVNMDQAISQASPKKPYIAPPMSLLNPPEPDVSQDEDYEYKKKVLVETLSFFDVAAEVVEIKVGPTFSLYTLHVEMPKGRTIGSLVNLENDIAMKMEEESVRILAPIPGKNAVGIEVPNKRRRIVRLSEILQSPKFNSSPSPATFGLGKDLFGAEYVCDIKELPHMLIAGATGAGKSCCINSLIISLLYKASPEEVRLIMVDPKRVELSVYSGIPHLMLDEIICDVDKAIRALNWSIAEMQRRIEYLSSLKYRDIDEYNQNCEKEGYEKMPRIIVIVDELADLMAQGKKAVEDAINRIARLARAVGIHLILATQRPSVDVVSGTIKNNLPSRVAFKVTSGPDSRTILDAGGAEKLLGYGDLFYMTPKIANPIRMQGAFISNSEVKSVVDFIKEHNESYYDEKIKDAIFKEKPDEAAEPKQGGGKRKDEKSGIPPEVFDAVRMGLEGNLITISSMQRKLGLGFPKAAKIFDTMKEMGLIEPDPESKKHKVCITEEELEELIRSNENNDEDGEE